MVWYSGTPLAGGKSSKSNALVCDDMQLNRIRLDFQTNIAIRMTGFCGNIFGCKAGKIKSEPSTSPHFSFLIFL